MSDDELKSGWMDWLARAMAWGTMKLPLIAPSRWMQDDRRLAASDMESHSFRIAADDGVMLDGWYFPPTKAADPTATHQGCAGRVPVFFSHGWTETKEFHLRLVRVLITAGHPVIIHDQRGHGRSQGTCTLGAREPDDLRAVIDEASRRGWAGDRIITMGVSMGGASVLRHAAQDKRVIGVVSYAPFTSFLHAIRSYGRRYFPMLSADWGVRGFVQCCRKRGFEIASANAIDVMSRITVPVLLVVGMRDINLPAADHARVLLEAASPGSARLIEVPDANHFNICMTRWPSVDEQVLAFLQSVCNSSTT